MADDKRNPHRNRESTDNLIPDRPDWDAERPRKRASVRQTPDLFGEYAIVFNEEWPPGRSIEYLRWSAAQSADVAAVLNRSAALLNRMVCATLGIDPSDDWLPSDKPMLGIKPGGHHVTPISVLRWIVREWRAFRARIPVMRTRETPLPDAITYLCRTAPGDMDNVLLGIFGKRIQEHFAEYSLKLQQDGWRQDENGQWRKADKQKLDWIDAQYRLMCDASDRLVKQVPWLQDGDFLDALSGEKIGQRKQTMH